MPKTIVARAALKVRRNPDHYDINGLPKTRSRGKMHKKLRRLLEFDYFAYNPNSRKPRRMPITTKRIDGKGFRRAAVWRTADFGKKQAGYAEYLRSKGYNARVIRNKNSVSIYMRWNKPGTLYSYAIPKDAPIDPRWTNPRPNTLGKGARTKNEVARFIYYRTHVENGSPPSTGQILEHLNSKFKWSVTTNQLSNYLAKDARFVASGFDSKTVQGRRTRQHSWELTPPPIENESEI